MKVFILLFYICFCVFLISKEFARRALGKIDNLARWERENDIPASGQTQSAFREASIKAGPCLPRWALSYFLLECAFQVELSEPFFPIYQLAAALFKRLVFENGKRSKPIFKPKSRSAVKEPPNVKLFTAISSHQYLSGQT